MVVVDTSVWIDFFRGRGTREVEILERCARAIRRVCVCGPVLQEVLQGLRDDREFRRTRLRLSKFTFLDATRETYSRAASLYRTMRKKGFTLGRFDAVIAGICLSHDLPLLTSDRRDFEPLARHAGLRLE